MKKLRSLSILVLVLSSCTSVGGNGSEAIIGKDGTVTYGLYPQTYVSDSSIIEALGKLTAPKSNGWYLLNGEYYAKGVYPVYDSVGGYTSGISFDDGTTIVQGTTYWFKCEPIRWKILSSSDGEYSLVSSVLLDVFLYYGYDYPTSEIRDWLNGDFYDSAFSLNDSLIETVTVDYPTSTSDDPGNRYAYESTEDKVYLLSYRDCAIPHYTQLSETTVAYYTAEQCKTTDWARVNGAYFNYDDPSVLYGAGWYWTRSSCYVNECGRFVGLKDVAYCYHISARPGITIKISR